MKYIIEEYVSNEYNASSKARKDISHFVLQNRYKSFFKNDKTRIRHNKTAKAALAIKLIVKALLKLDSKDIVFLQTSYPILKAILFIKRLKRFKIVYLIHDLYTLRYNNPLSIEQNSSMINHDMHILSKCDYIIAHNEYMISRLKERGCNSNFISLEIFDYYTENAPKTRVLCRESCISISYAGTLKNDFLYVLDELCYKNNIKFFTYGKPEPHFAHSLYKGSFDADVLPSVIEGDFGLIWTFSMQPDEADCYELLNNPHKLSMYIVAGIPAITWNKSAAGKFIEKENIGFTVDSIEDMFAKLNKITPNQYDEMVRNCQRISKLLINGEHTKQALNQCI